MTNPFEQISERLANIESLLIELKHKPVEETKSEMVTVEEASKLLKLSKQSIRAYIKKGLLPAKRAGRSYLIKRADIEEALQDVKSLKYKRA